LYLGGNYFDVMASTNQPLAVTVPLPPIDPIASTRSYSPTVGAQFLQSQDYTELMPQVSNQTTNLCPTSDKVFMIIYIYYHYNVLYAYVSI